jgi:hypothetical protein
MRRLMLALVVVLAACGGAAPTPTPAPSADPTWPLGDGGITFGMAFSEETFKITAPSATFPRAYAGIVWFIASFSEAPGATSLTATLTRQSAAPLTTEALVWSHPTPIPDPGNLKLVDGRSLAELGALQPGTYVMRFMRDATVLAEGTFEVH